MPAEIARRGKKKDKGRQVIPNAPIATKARFAKYHSGIRNRDWMRPDPS
jgi:hypothetical protein